jgi:hypothetical protein
MWIKKNDQNQYSWLKKGVNIDQDHILLAYDPRTHPNHYYELNLFYVILAFSYVIPA